MNGEIDINRMNEIRSEYCVAEENKKKNVEVLGEENELYMYFHNRVLFYEFH